MIERRARGLWPLLLVLAWVGVAPAAENGAAEIYAAECAFCHGPSGGGDGQASGMLTPRPTAFSDAAFWKSADPVKLAESIAHGKAGTAMMGYGGRLSKQQIDALLVYLESLAK